MAVVGGYVLLGATAIILKTESPLQRPVQGDAEYPGAGRLFSIGVASIPAPFQDPEHFQRQLIFGATFPVF
jgi:cytochrome d ubiquinol oxidase subunit II